MMKKKKTEEVKVMITSCNLSIYSLHVSRSQSPLTTTMPTGMAATQTHTLHQNALKKAALFHILWYLNGPYRCLVAAPCRTAACRTPAGWSGSPADADDQGLREDWRRNSACTRAHTQIRHAQTYDNEDKHVSIHAHTDTHRQTSQTKSCSFCMKFSDWAQVLKLAKK